jgi:2-methylcitrate dehydratase PrpD
MRGFTANPEAIEANQGYADAAGSGRSELRWGRLEELRQRWLIRDTLFKYHAACYLTHAAIESAARLRSDGAKSEEVSEVVLTVHPSLLDVCGIRQPRTGLEAKFSLAATTAMALLGLDTTNPATFVDQTLGTEKLQQLIPRIGIETDESLRSTQAQVVLSQHGERRSATHDSGVPASDLGQQSRKLAAKFNGLVEPILGAERTARLSSSLMNLETRPDASSLDS